MLITEGPLPVHFQAGGQEYVCDKSVLQGKIAKQILSMMAEHDKVSARAPKPEDILDACSDVRYQARLVQMTFTKDGQEIDFNEAKEICDESNVIEVADALVRRSGWEEIKNSLAARENERLALAEKSQASKTNTNSSPKPTDSPPIRSKSSTPTTT